MSIWDAFEEMVEEEARRLAKRTAEGMEEMTEEERERVLKVYAEAQKGLVEVGKLLGEGAGFVLSEETLTIAARLALIAFDALVKLTAAGVRAGYDEKLALAITMTYLFDQPLLTSIAIVFRASTLLPEDFVRELESKRGAREGGWRRKKGKNPPK